MFVCVVVIVVVCVFFFMFGIGVVSVGLFVWVFLSVLCLLGVCGVFVCGVACVMFCWGL